MERFFKYQGLGNDFVVLDRRTANRDIRPADAIALCDRRRGIGADGVLVLLPSEKAPCRMVVHNADGSVAEMCGNGLRCVVKYLADAQGTQPSVLAVETGAGLLESSVAYDADGASIVTVAMGPAMLKAPGIPSGVDGSAFVNRPIGGLRGTAVSMGDPHLVLLDTPPEHASRLGPELERNSLFAVRTNVEFCRTRADGGLDVVVWERGVGITQACGTGACAATAAAALAGRVAFDAWVPVRLPGGTLDVKVAADLSQVWLRGPAVKVFEGDLQ